MRAEFFDIFGLIGFGILLMISIKMLSSKKMLPAWMKVIVLMISILGLIIDGYIVITTYLIN